MSSGPADSLVALLVEDNPADVVFFREIAAAIRGDMDIHVVPDGVQALRFLRRETPFDQAPRPDVVVVDMNLPGKNGLEVVMDMAADRALNTIPVAILTSSELETGVCELYPAGRCSRFIKTADLAVFQDIVRKIAVHAGKGHP
jgi:CheY-like chemotaxis protein